MALGAYSIVRYANDLNDQRINLGVLVWHPVDGLHERMSPYLDRAQAVDPRVRVSDIKQQINAILGSFTKPAEVSGKDHLRRLASTFRSGVEVTSPYPAEMFDVEAMLEKLYSELVSPTEEFRRASSQKQYETKLRVGLAAVLRRLAPGSAVKEGGQKKLNGIAVDLGIRTLATSMRASWHALSLQSEDRPADQLAKAKATALDIATIRTEITELRNDRQIVAVQPPKPKASERLSESVAWLKHHADDVIMVPGDAVVPVLEEAIARMLSKKSVAAGRK